MLHEWVYYFGEYLRKILQHIPVVNGTEDMGTMLWELNYFQKY